MARGELLVLVGPTASGKTAASLEVARAMDLEIVSADSMQVYRGMDIGTAKATPEERARVPHHMIDVADVGEGYSAARYAQEATRAVEEIRARGKDALMVGGTGLYVSALIDGLDFAGVQTSDEERARWRAYLEEHGAAALHERLRACDPASAQRLHPNDTHRVMRALEVFHLTGRPVGEAAGFAKEPRYPARIAGLDLPRELLYERINRRVGRMVRDGLVEEARVLYEGGAAPTAAQALGYKELFGYFRGEIGLEEALENIRRRTRHYAKRQMTWFRRDARIAWFDGQATDLSVKLHSFFSERCT